MGIQIVVDKGVCLHIPYRHIIEECIELTIKSEHCPCKCEVSVTITDNRGIKKINKQFRNIDKATDVLSFPLQTYTRPAYFDDILDRTNVGAIDPDTDELMLGDIVISADKVKSQSKLYGHTQKRELAFLVVHAMLHLFGYDHMTDNDVRVMELRQRSILDGGGYKR